MLSKRKIALCVAIVLGTGCAASAATRHHGVSHGHPANHNAVSTDSGHSCPPTCSNFCPSTGPCRINSDEW